MGMNGRPRYRSEQSSKTINYTSGWWLLAENYKGESWYAAHSKSATPPLAGWICGHRGAAPLPKVDTQEVTAPVIDHAKQAEDPYSTARVQPLQANSVSASDSARVGRASHQRQDAEIDPALGPIVNPTPRE